MQRCCNQPDGTQYARMRCTTRLAIMLLMLTGLTSVIPRWAVATEFSLRFYGHGVAAPDLDRVKIPIDDVGNSNPGPPADIGADDLTIEFFMKASAVENPAPPITCGANVDWIYGHVILDRDRFNQDRKFGISVAGGRIVFGVSGDGTGDRTICSTTNVLDGAWHHVAVQRRRSDGWLWLYVDGILEAQADGPDGDISYPDDGVPCSNCCGSGDDCDGSDPFIVLGAEKHDAGASYPSYSGFLDELRLSSALRYAADFSSPSEPFVADGDTAALYHFDEGPAGPCSGAIVDSTAGNASPGFCAHGGSAPAGPVYSTDSAFNPAPSNYDAVVDPLQPLSIKLRSPATVSKKVRVKVWNGSPAGSADTEIEVLATSPDCPVGTIVGQPDFDSRNAGDQNSAIIAPGRGKTARFVVEVDPNAFTSVTPKTPTRCTILLTAQATTANNTDPTPANNVAHIELNVLDLTDADQGVPEVRIESLRTSKPGKMEIRSGESDRTKAIKVAVINAGPAAATLNVAVDDGDCPPGTVGLPDLDQKTAGAQDSLLVGAGRKAQAVVPITVSSDDFTSPTARSLGRCAAGLTVTSDGGDADAANSTIRVLVNVADRNDM